MKSDVLLVRKSIFLSKGHSKQESINPLHKQSEKPACASKQDMLEL